MKKSILIAIAVAAIVAAAAYFAYGQASPQQGQTTTVTVTVWKTPWGAASAANATNVTGCAPWPGPRGRAYWRGPGHAAHPRAPIGAINATATAAPLTAEKLSISLTSSQASLILNATALTRGGAVAAVVEGQGTLTIGGQQYQIEAVDGFASSNAFALRIYTGNALILLEYAGGVYRAVVEPLGVTQIIVYYGNATAQISA